MSRNSPRKGAKAVILAAACSLLAASAPPADETITLTRLDCGDFLVKNYNASFSDTSAYPEGSKRLVGSCYLIRNKGEYLLWDLGLPKSLIGRSYDTPMQSLTLRTSLIDQLDQLGIAPDQIGRIGVSHWHFDHVGQANDFANARLLIGKADADALRDNPPADQDSFDALKHWLSSTDKLDLLSGDKDVFGDGRVIVLDTPGHTAGHHSLLVRLASGPVLLSGDLYHFTEQVEKRGVPTFNHNRADTLASMDRFDRLASHLRAKVIIQHEPSDVTKLPLFPAAAH